MSKLPNSSYWDSFVLNLLLFDCSSAAVHLVALLTTGNDTATRKAMHSTRFSEHAAVYSVAGCTGNSALQ